MATIHENKLVGKEMVKQRKYRWDSTGKVLEEVETKHDGDAEAGVDPQQEQLNDMPNDPTDRPLENTERKQD